MTDTNLTAGSAGNTGFSTLLGGRLVVVAIGSKSQTVSICTAANRRGEYEDRYRIVGRAPLLREDVDAHGSVEELRGWLGDLGASAKREDPQTPGRTLPSLIPAPAAHDRWLTESISVAEAEIDRLV